MNVCHQQESLHRATADRPVSCLPVSWPGEPAEGIVTMMDRPPPSRETPHCPTKKDGPPGYQ